jgi:hypothetical protein
MGATEDEARRRFSRSAANVSRTHRFGGGQAGRDPE